HVPSVAITSTSASRVTVATMVLLPIGFSRTVARSAVTSARCAAAGAHMPMIAASVNSICLINASPRSSYAQKAGASVSVSALADAGEAGLFQGGIGALRAASGDAHELTTGAKGSTAKAMFGAVLGASGVRRRRLHVVARVVPISDPFPHIADG